MSSRAYVRDKLPLTLPQPPAGYTYDTLASSMVNTTVYLDCKDGLGTPIPSPGASPSPDPRPSPDRSPGGPTSGGTHAGQGATARSGLHTASNASTQPSCINPRRPPLSTPGAQPPQLRCL
jgi:hypothetical protein